MEHAGARIGYRKLPYKYTSSKDAEIDLSYEGPMAGLSILF